jgi:poly [ADP-ribose] polymerase
MSYDAKKLPLGKLSERTLKAGFSVLKELAELLVDPSLATTRYGTSLGPAQESLSNRYFTLIPHVFGRNRPPILVNDAMIRKEVELLEALTDMDVANEILKDSKQADEIHQLDRQFQSLGMEEMTRREYNIALYHNTELTISKWTPNQPSSASCPTISTTLAALPTISSTR